MLESVEHECGQHYYMSSWRVQVSAKNFWVQMVVQISIKIKSFVPYAIHIAQLNYHQ